MRFLRYGWMLLFFITNVYAVEAVDVYGVDDKTADAILAANRQDIIDYVQYAKAEREGHAKKGIDSKAMRRAIVDKIKRMGSFAYANLSVITYQSEGDFVTIDLVTEKERYRIPHSPQRLIKQSMTIDPHVKDLIALWADYEKDYLHQFLTHSYDVSIKRSCPALHCTFGFDAKDLVKYYQPMQKGAVQYQQELIDIIAHSPDNQMRSQAIFVLAHVHDAALVTQVMSQYIDDKSSMVRNNVMRVLVYIALNHDSKAMPLNKLIEALNYPCTTDRNKAQMVLLHIARKDPSTHATIIKKGAHFLVSLIKLYQLNNHEAAYEILKIVSHKTYGDRDIKAWLAWANKAQGPG